MKEKLFRFLLKYRIMPHSSTGVAPGELLMARSLRSCLDLLKPDLSTTVQDHQLEQKLSHDSSIPYRTFSEGEEVYVEDFTTAKQKLIPGTIQRTWNNSEGKRPTFICCCFIKCNYCEKAC